MIPKSILNRLAAVEERVGAKAPAGFTTFHIDGPIHFQNPGDWLRSQGHDVPAASIVITFVDAQNPHREPRLREIRPPRPN